MSLSALHWDSHESWPSCARLPGNICAWLGHFDHSMSIQANPTDIQEVQNPERYLPKRGRERPIDGNRKFSIPPHPHLSLTCTPIIKHNVVTSSYSLPIIDITNHSPIVSERDVTFDVDEIAGVKLWDLVCCYSYSPTTRLIFTKGNSITTQQPSAAPVRLTRMFVLRA